MKFSIKSINPFAFLSQPPMTQAEILLHDARQSLLKAHDDLLLAQMKTFEIEAKITGIGKQINYLSLF